MALNKIFITTLFCGFFLLNTSHCMVKTTFSQEKCGWTEDNILDVILAALQESNDPLIDAETAIDALRDNEALLNSVDVNKAMDDKGETLLIKAAKLAGSKSSGYPISYAYSLMLVGWHSKIDVNKQDSHGATALHYLLRNHKNGITAKHLNESFFCTENFGRLAIPVRLDILDNQGKTVLDYAIERPDTDAERTNIIELLLAKGATANINKNNEKLKAKSNKYVKIAGIAAFAVAVAGAGAWTIKHNKAKQKKKDSGKKDIAPTKNKNYFDETT